ncbi:hypothetical protein ASF76_14285 [Microbacterium sp. Leaf151]|nr:hypothetical protein ASF76_14285 [Microbacterium sp. Leaf151]
MGATEEDGEGDAGVDTDEGSGRRTAKEKMPATAAMTTTARTTAAMRAADRRRWRARLVRTEARDMDAPFTDGGHCYSPQEGTPRRSSRADARPSVGEVRRGERMRRSRPRTTCFPFTFRAYEDIRRVNLRVTSAC